MRNRPEESPHATTAIGSGSVNPSPKKQPRLNLQQSSSGCSASSNELQHYNNDESMCKRYKLEDQLSDIQYIDCSTPEHTINNPNTIYASVQIHNPPASSHNSSVSTVNDIDHTPADKSNDVNLSTGSGASRYSYPGTKFRNTEPEKRYKEERFSYPGMGKKFVEDTNTKYICRGPVDATNVPAEELMTRSQSSRNQKLTGILRRSSSSEMSKFTDVDRSKLSIATTTPTTPARSPRYSLLVGGDTTGSSGNSSLLSTPVYEMDVSCTGGMLHMLPVDLDQSKESHMLLPYEAKEHTDQMMENSSIASMTASEKRDIAQIKVEMSLDLGGSKMSVDGDASQSSSHNIRHVINIPSTPNTPNYTHTSGNTSQSMTPSEFGYTHLNRQSGVVSLESSPKATERNAYANLEECFNNYDKTVSEAKALQATSAKAASPIRSTINITYNLKSPRTTPTHENIFFANNMENNKQHTAVSSDYELVNVVTVPPNVVVIDVAAKQQKKPLLETSFDENMVYEQVKCYKGVISEVNSLLAGGNNGNSTATGTSIVESQKIDPDIAIEPQTPEPHHYANVEPLEINSNSVMSTDNETLLFLGSNCDDVPMYDNELDIQDSLEVDASLSLYENVELRRPDSVYQNVEIRQMDLPTKTPTVMLPLREQKPKNFTVRQLANKFETSPVDTPPPFDFSKPFGGRSMGSVKQLDNNRNSPCAIKAKNSKQLHKSAKITRSLDENAFIREFGGSTAGSANIKLETILNKSSQQISEIDGRRMSLEFTRPKSLNPPKRLPNLQDAGETEICKADSQKLTLNLTKALSEPSKVISPPKYDIKITPTTENPISLIQHNVELATEKQQPPTSQLAQPYEEDKASLSSIKVLGNCKLDRDRIEKIKEERRHQLNEKFRSESFRATAGSMTGATPTDAHDYTREKIKSKSKIELRDLKDSTMDTGHHHHKAESLRFKSKSRGDISSTDSRPTKDELLDRHVVATTLGLISAGRVRRISDEKNQNECVDYITDVDAKLAELVTTTKARKKDIDGGNNGVRDRDNISVTTTRNSLNSQ